MENISVSIICNTYNHEKYVKDALDGFVMQKTNFPFEILIHDDASTDNTANIIREYEKKYPDIIKPIYQTENQYSKGKGLVGKIQYARAKGKYIAFCEGDDYWTDPYKLQKQYDALEKHPEIDICTTAALKVDAKTNKRISVISLRKENAIISLEDVIAGGGGFVATATIFCRENIIHDTPKFVQILSLDYTLQIHGALRGGMLFLSDITGVYRWLTDNSWTQRKMQNSKAIMQHTQKVNSALKVLDKETNGKYSDTINNKIIRNEFFSLVNYGDIRQIKDKKYKKTFNNLSIKDKVKIMIKFYFPWLLKIKRNLKSL